MTTDARLGTDADCNPELIAEAAAWIAVLHGPNRTQVTEQGFALWLKKSRAHARAFEEATEIWEEASKIPRPQRLREATPVQVERSFRLRRRPGIAVVAAGVTVAAAAVIAVALYIRATAVVSTGTGEQRMLTLDDGSHVVLNTQTRLAVAYDRNQRRIELMDGEALFEVAQRPNWPFIVKVGTREVRALGTSFVIKFEGARTGITVVDGRVSVVSPEAAVSASTPILGAGQRLMFASAAPTPHLDRPVMEKVLAWERREVALDDTALSVAMAEMNRYSRKKLVADVPDVESVRVTGLFRAGDSLSFAKAVAGVYGLEVAESSNEVRISRPD